VGLVRSQQQGLVRSQQVGQVIQVLAVVGVGKHITMK